MCIFSLTKEIVQPISIRRKQFLSFSTFIFLSILTKNCYSQLPASKAITATMQLPFCYSITFCIAFNLLFLLRHKPIEALSFFIPAAIPLEMAPFLWIIELISHLIKVISLAVRLCANISSGHVLLDTILTALFLILVKGGAALFLVFLVFQIVGFAIQLLETFIGFLQAFVFLTLTSIYTAEIFGGDH
jgi:F-type H+-transporting ATPase subunit a